MFKGIGLQSHYRSVWGTHKLRRVKFMVSGVYRNKPRPFRWVAHKRARSSNVMNSRTKVGGPTEQDTTVA